MSNIGSSFLLLALAILLLWLAVTDKLSNLIDGFEVAIGKAKASTTAAAPAVGNISFSLPTMPANATTAQVGL